MPLSLVSGDGLSSTLLRAKIIHQFATAAALSSTRFTRRTDLTTRPAGACRYDEGGTQQSCRDAAVRTTRAAPTLRRGMLKIVKQSAKTALGAVLETTHTLRVWSTPRSWPAAQSRVAHTP
jgi:hypothetical protein